MNEKDLWLLFKSTGKIEYYLKYKNKKKENDVNDQNNRRNHH